MKRRQFIKQSLTYAAGLTAFSAGSVSCTRSTSVKPNIIYILADDLGYGDLSCFGQVKFDTPILDRMAEEGMRFTNHYAGSPICAPSRASLLTGMHTGHSSVRGNYSIGQNGTVSGTSLRPEDLTIIEILKEAGYATGVFGKWGLGEMNTAGQPDKKGVDEFFGYLDQMHAHFYYTDYLWKNGKKVVVKENQDGKRGRYVHDLIFDESMKFIRENKDKPFFLYLPWTLPHAEMLVPDDSMAPFRGKWPEVPYYSEKDELIPNHYATQLEPLAAFAGMVRRLDRDVGRVLDLLKELHLDENTLVIFASDNGPHKEGGHRPDFFDSSGPLRGYKRDLFEGGIRVPMVASWPGKITPGTESNHVSAFWDFLPTVCDLVGAAVPENIDGLSFLPAILGKKQRKHDYLYWEFPGEKTTSQAVRVGNWKAVRQAPSGPMELYNLYTDIGEKNDVAELHPEIVARLNNLLDTSRTENEIWPLKDI